MTAFFSVGAMMASFLVESSSWWIKAACPTGKIGLYVSRSNIYLYFGRFFTLAYSALIALSIEKGSQANFVSLILALGFLAAFSTHILLLLGGKPTEITVRLLSRTLRLPSGDLQPSAHRKFDRKIVVHTATASFCFSIGITLPLLLAVMIPQYRMSLTYAGQIVNAVGTILLLFMVDQRLFKSLDEGTLQHDLPSYSLGRAVALGLASAICFLIFIAVQHN
ncbi:hypothetical protein [uncultured Parasphingorhabdus sp.]|uniref:hypothetical protein n=1 Tax=uncultured Parasphingorhabdus sp. TaxID=2709694 RepID=UPI0030DD8261